MADISVALEQLQARLAAGAQKLGISLTEQQLNGLLDYLQLLIKWNKAYNLTAIRNPIDMIDLHLLDSLAVHPFLGDAKNIIDVGTGPGLPGMVLAIMNPERQFTLLDSNGKKTRFLFQARVALGLDNVNIINGRVEAYQPPQPFDMITSRAFASLADMTSWCHHLLAESGCFLAMKGQYPVQELAEIEADYQLQSSDEITVPGVDGQRHVLRIVPVR